MKNIMKNNKLQSWIHENIICRIFKNDTAICVMGLFSGIKYKLGVAKEGIDFKTVK